MADKERVHHMVPTNTFFQQTQGLADLNGIFSCCTDAKNRSEQARSSGSAVPPAPVPHASSGLGSAHFNLILIINPMDVGTKCAHILSTRRRGLLHWQTRRLCS